MTVTSMLHIPAMSTFTIACPTNAHTGSYFQMVSPTQISEARMRNSEMSLDRLQKPISATEIRDPMKMPRTGSPASKTSFPKYILKSGMRWHSGLSPENYIKTMM